MIIPCYKRYQNKIVIAMTVSNATSGRKRDGPKSGILRQSYDLALIYDK